jgi:hypothetical protein
VRNDVPLSGPCSVSSLYSSASGILSAVGSLKIRSRGIVQIQERHVPGLKSGDEHFIIHLSKLPMTNGERHMRS